MEMRCERRESGYERVGRRTISEGCSVGLPGLVEHLSGGVDELDSVVLDTSAQHFDTDSGATHWFRVVRGRDHDPDSSAFQSLGPKDGKESSSEYDNGEAVCSRYNVNLTIQTGKRRGYLELRATHSVRNPAVPYE